ncbi:DUF805 domain-containing protein [Asticcacaulis sp. AC466]|uniref:DUF805 domain-containing protein n=1 Tax=Asticcacaulis sp. AC466 TaxID=1282362 RepID=UPI000408DD51|nr:DUF805 domain-containing protein [Asticcacaulis sp. AC466]
MSSVPLMFQPLVKYVDFQGRSRRSEFWLWVLFRLLVGAVMGTISTSFMLSGIDMNSHNPEQFMSRYLQIMPIFSLINLGLLLPTLAVGVRRLHDINRTGWWLVMPIVVAFAGLILFFIIFGSQFFTVLGSGGQMTDAQSMHFVGQMLGSMFLCLFLPVLISQIVMLVFYVTDGTPGPNRFGADPKGRGLPATPEVMF